MRNVKSLITLITKVEVVASSVMHATWPQSLQIFGLRDLYLRLYFTVYICLLLISAVLATIGLSLKTVTGMCIQ